MSKKPPKSKKNKKQKTPPLNKKEKNNFTKTLQNPEKLTNGLSYYFLDKEQKSTMDQFKNLVEKNNYKGLYITRTNSQYINNTHKKIKTIILKQKNLDEILNIIKKFIKQKTKSVILLDRADYLISNFSFNQFIKHLYKITEIISDNHSIFLLYIKKSIFDEKQLSLITNELLPITSQNLEEIQLKDDYYEILKIINRFYTNNIVIEYKRISDELSINRKTLSKKINYLTKKGLIIVNKSGRSKIPYLTDKAKTILNKNL